MLRRCLFVTIVTGAVAVFALAQAAQQDGGGRRGRGGEGAGERGEGRRFDASQMRGRMMDSMKEQSGASDEEWKKIQSKVEKIWDIQRDMRTGFGGFGFGGRARGGDAPADQGPQSKVAETLANLRVAANDKNTPAEDLTRKLGAFREARDKAREEVKQLQKELKGSVTPREEAVLVLNGILE